MSFLGFSTASYGAEHGIQGSPQRIGSQQQQHHHHHQQHLHQHQHEQHHHQQQHRPDAPSKPSADDELQRLTKEYQEEAARLSEQLSLCGIQQHYLSPEAQQSLKLLVQLACVLQITQTTPQALLSAWAMLVVRHSKATTVQRKLQRELSSLAQKRSTAQQKLTALQKVLQDVQSAQSKEAAKASGHIKMTRQLQEKRSAYEAQSRKLEQDLAKSGFRPELKHSALLEKHSELQELQQQLAELTQQLNRYHELPATLLGARMKLGEARKQLEEKQERFKSHLADS